MAVCSKLKAIWEVFKGGNITTHVVWIILITCHAFTFRFFRMFFFNLLVK